LRHASLLSRSPNERVVSVHRLVQEIVRELLDEESQRYWADLAIRLVGAAFPSTDYLTTWARCQRYLPHALACVEAIDRWHLNSPEAIQLLTRTAAYLREQAQEERAKVLATLVTRLQSHSSAHADSDAMTEFFTFMRIAYYQGSYHAKSAFIQEQMMALHQRLGPDHPDLIYLRVGQAFLLQMEGKYLRAEELYREALTMKNVSLLYQRLSLSIEAQEERLPHVGFVLSMLGQLYTTLGKYEQAETCFQQAGSIWEQHSRLPPHLFKGAYLHGLAHLHILQGQNEPARDLLQQERLLLTEILGTDHPIGADNQNGFAQLELARGEVALAEQHLQQARGMFERSTGLEHPFAVQTFHLWAQLRLKQRNLEQAEACCRQAMQISDRTQGPDHLMTGRCLKTLVDILHFRAQSLEAALLSRRALAIVQNALGASHPEYAATRSWYEARAGDQ
jgi:tetratricopeptide (TPR) repeat protein